MFMTYSERENVNAILAPYRMWAYNSCDYTEKEAEFIIGTKLDNEIKELKSKLRILELARCKLDDEGL